MRDTVLMSEIYSRALILSTRDINDVDVLVTMFTQTHGKVVARAKSMRKITSKCAPHFQPLSFVKARFIPRAGVREGFVLLDGVADQDLPPHKTRTRADLLPFITFIDAHTFPLQQDPKLWLFLNKIFSAYYRQQDVARLLLSLLGFDPKEADCVVCKQHPVSAFNVAQEEFLCRSCALKFRPNEILLVEK